MPQTNKTTWLKTLIPLALILVAVLIAWGIVALKPEQQKKEAERILPTVEVYEVTEMDEALLITSQGAVEPRRKTHLTARVSGHIETVSPDFYEGGQFQEGDVLIELDPLPYESALAEARSRLALAESALLQEKEAADQARKDWMTIGTGEPNPLVLREPQLMKARADKEAAEVAVKVATENLNYAKIKAPYDGRVDRKLVDVGQAITGQATILGEIHASDAMEVAVPLSLDELSFLEPEQQPTAVLGAEIAGEAHEWTAYLDRIAASVDSRSRMITAIIRIDQPFLSEGGMLLRPGMFVGVNIRGKELGQLYRVPRSALHPGDIVYRLTTDNRLESESLDVMYTDEETALVKAGVESGDRLCVTPLLFFVEGMQVQVAGDATPENNADGDDAE